MTVKSFGLVAIGAAVGLLASKVVRRRRIAEPGPQAPKKEPNGMPQGMPYGIVPQESGAV